MILEQNLKLTFIYLCIHVCNLVVYSNLHRNIRKLSNNPEMDCYCCNFFCTSWSHINHNNPFHMLLSYKFLNLWVLGLVSRWEKKELMRIIFMLHFDFWFSKTMKVSSILDIRIPGLESHQNVVNMTTIAMNIIRFIVIIWDNKSS